MKQSLERTLTDPCPYCSGSAVIKSTSTICYEILSEVRKLRGELRDREVLMRVNPDIARALREEEQEVGQQLQEALGPRVIIKPDVNLHHEQFDVMTC